MHLLPSMRSEYWADDVIESTCQSVRCDSCLEVNLVDGLLVNGEFEIGEGEKCPCCGSIEFKE